MNYTVNVSIPKSLAELAKKEVEKGYYSSLSEVIRESLRNQLINKKVAEVPIIKLSEKAERIALKALDDYKKGKTIKASSFEKLAKL